jgi:hypothetical protein
VNSVTDSAVQRIHSHPHAAIDAAFVSLTQGNDAVAATTSGGPDRHRRAFG